MDTYETEFTPKEETVREEAEYQPEQETVYMRKKQSPFADSPYVTAFDILEPQSKPQKPKRDHTKGWKRVITACLAVVLLVGACGVTGVLVSDHYRKQLAALSTAMDERIDVLQEQLAASSGQSGSNAVVKPNAAMTPVQVYEKTNLAVVSITNEAVAVIDGVETKYGSAGTGFIISEDGYIVSNYHVIEDAESLSVTTGTGKIYEAQVVGFDAENDFSLLKIDATDLPFVTLGSSDSTKIGEQVVAIGYPLNNDSPTLTVGYISAKDRVITTQGKTINMLQTDAAINSGNSGGPLLNMRGEVVGITTAKSSGTTETGVDIESVGFAIPVDDIAGMIADLREYGYITGAYLGVWVREVAQEAQSYGLPAGVYVEDVMDGCAAQRAGLKSGDIIVNLGGYEIKGMTDLTLALRKFKAGQTVSVTVYRNGAQTYLSITLDEKPQEETQQEIPESTEPTQSGYDQWYDSLPPFFKDWLD